MSDYKLRIFFKARSCSVTYGKYVTFAICPHPNTHCKLTVFVLYIIYGFFIFDNSLDNEAVEVYFLNKVSREILDAIEPLKVS